MSIPDEFAAHPDYVAYSQGLIASRLRLIERVENCDLADPIAVALMLRFVQKESDLAPVDFLVALPNMNFGNLLDMSHGCNMPSQETLGTLRNWIVERLAFDIHAMAHLAPSERKKAL